LYGDLPESKRRKFILVEDNQRNTRVRVRVQLDQINLQDIPDSYRKQNSVYPRAYFPQQMQDPSEAPRNSRLFAEDEDDGGVQDTTVSKTLVPIPLLEGEKLALPRVSKAKRKRENTLNEMGYRMSWSQGRVFAGRVLFLQKSCKSYPLSWLSRYSLDFIVDAYRNKMRSSIIQNSQSQSEGETEPIHVAPQFLTRMGKQRWLDHTRRTKKEDDS
jgi:hypothetical protein